MSTVPKAASHVSSLTHPGLRNSWPLSRLSRDIQPTGHLFADRLGLPDGARKLVRQACRELGIQQLGTHGFRKTFSVEEYHRARSNGADDRQALLVTSHKLGHNRIDVTRQSYVSSDEREKGAMQ